MIFAVNLIDTDPIPGMFEHEFEGCEEGYTSWDYLETRRGLTIFEQQQRDEWIEDWKSEGQDHQIHQRGTDANDGRYYDGRTYYTRTLIQTLPAIELDTVEEMARLLSGEVTVVNQWWKGTFELKDHYVLHINWE
jgi:hypothetical protein